MTETTNGETAADITNQECIADEEERYQRFLARLAIQPNDILAA